LTVCSGVDFRLPAWFALPRSDCTVASTAAWSARNASPSFCVHDRFSFICLRTCGTEVSALTLSSHVCFCIASSSALSLTLGFSLVQRAASTTSSGYVLAIRICAISASG
jgi:hypothetical protein